MVQHRLIFVLLLIAIEHFISSTSSEVPSDAESVKYANRELLQKQKFCLEILRHPYQSEVIPEEYLAYTKEWISDESKYLKYDEVKQFFAVFKGEHLGKGEIFTIFNENLLEQAKLLFRFFYNAINWDTFFRNVIWARANVNEGMFIYALTLAVIHRQDLHGINLPVIYELSPHFFFDAGVMNYARVRTMEDPDYGFHPTLREYITVNKSALSTGYNTEGQLAYFTEDIGLNAYYYYYKLEYAAFLGGDGLGLNRDRRGELFLYMHQQLLARYYLERQSNGLGPIAELAWEPLIPTGYYSMLRHWNGITFKKRVNNLGLAVGDVRKLQKLKDLESSLKQTIDQGHLVLANGTTIDLRSFDSVDFLGNMIESNADSVNSSNFSESLEVLGRLIVEQTSYNDSVGSLWNGALAFTETTMRDPVFYQMLELNLGVYWQFKNQLKPYTQQELNFPGVQIKSFRIEKLTTYFENFDIDISNGLPFANSENRTTWDFKVFARQQRLNHKPFNYTLSVASNYTGKAIVRMYMGPAISGFENLPSVKKYFVEMDQYMINLIPGENLIERNTSDFYFDIADRTIYSELYQRTLDALDGRKPFALDMAEAICGWPDRLLLPRGLPDGFDISLFFIVSPYRPPKVPQFSTFDAFKSCGAGSGSKYTEDSPFGFPLDRKLDMDSFLVQNMLLQNVTIYHLDSSPNEQI
ncbi:hexamerin-1.1-like [Uranotaenia lowii]|uniref:hexamerin-1.1-like n=1 Tax=Uranotaenia lowii TaxID=190385 RepID=UPI00247854A0|nr:hexamerin-1.1-like [Uranotaenia lowii]